MRSYLILLLTSGLFAAEYRAPAGDRPVIPRPGAVSVLPGGRMIQPLGRQYATGPGPFGIAVSPTGEYTVTANGGPTEFGLSVLTRDDRGRYRMRHVIAPKEDSDEARSNSWRSVFMGIAFADNDKLFVSEGESGRVRHVFLKNKKKVRLYEMNLGTSQDSYSGDLVYDPRRKVLYALDQANFRLVAFDARSRRVLASLPVGRLPFAIDLSEDGRRVLITHIGMFEYQRIAGADISRPRETGLDFPAFGFPSPAATNGTDRAPGLGDPNSETASAVSVVNVEDLSDPRIEAYVRTGKPVGAGSLGGSSPSGVLAAGGRVWVANAHNDSISVLDPSSWKVTREIEIRIPGLEALRGVMPIGLAYHQASGWLLVAEAGINAIGVIDTQRMEVIGHIPSAWFPSQLVIHEDTVYVVNTKGHGTGANANRMVGFRDGFKDPIHRGAITTFP
ncbi:MAG: hypothetical protein GY953_56655, partial [bacterium]|nr:hypothetical protein [bacterium]